MTRGNCWWLVALLLAVLSLDNVLQALNWFQSGERPKGEAAEDMTQELHEGRQEGDSSLYERAMQGAKSMVENVASSGKRAKESLEDTGRRAASSLSQSYEENVARPLRLMTAREDDFWWPWMEGPSLHGRPPWTHSIASLGQFRSFPNEYIVYLDLPGVPKEELDVFLQGHRLRVHGTHGTCLAGGEGEIDRFCLERQVDRSFSIPDDVETEHVEALLKDGVLIVKLPRMVDESDPAGRGESAGMFGGKRLRLHGKRVAVKDYRQSWRERAKEAGEAVRDTFIHKKRQP